MRQRKVRDARPTRDEEASCSVPVTPPRMTQPVNVTSLVSMTPAVRPGATWCCQ